MDANEFNQYWMNNYRDVLPISYKLRDYFFNDRWFRIHSLPDSKRYSENEEEMKIILDRQNALITDLIGIENDYLLFLYSISETEKSLKKLNEMDFSNSFIILKSDVFNEGEDKSFLLKAFTSLKWKEKSIDNYLINIANENPVFYKSKKKVKFPLNRIYNMLLIDVAKNRIIAPYDGGVDIILSSKIEKKYYKKKYKEWLSFTDNGF